jgi:hypothetical protein
LEAAVSLNANAAEAHLKPWIVYVRLARKEEGEARHALKRCFAWIPDLIRNWKHTLKTEYSKVAR